MVKFDKYTKKKPYTKTINIKLLQQYENSYLFLKLSNLKIGSFCLFFNTFNFKSIKLIKMCVRKIEIWDIKRSERIYHFFFVVCLQ